MIRTMRLSFLLFSCLLSPMARAQEEPQFSLSDYDRFLYESELAECRTVFGVIEALEPRPDGATIRLRAESVTETRKQRKSGEKPPHPKAQTSELRGLNPKHPPVIWRWDRESSETFSFHWDNTHGPPPLCRGMKAKDILNASGDVLDISFVASVVHWRTRTDGPVEVVLGYKDEHTPVHYLYVLPAKISGGSDIHWTRKWGTLITTDGLAPDVVEIEPLVSGRRALPIANAAGMKIEPGRDGWKALPTVDEALRNLTPAETKAWDAFLRAIPKRQKMQGPG